MGSLIYSSFLTVQRSVLLYSKVKIKGLGDSEVEVQMETLSAKNKKWIAVND